VLDMTIADAITECYDAHDSADIDRIMATLTPIGTFQDPGTDGPVSGDAVAADFKRRSDLFRDRVCTVITSGAWNETDGAAMFSASLRHIESGKVIRVDGAEFFTYEPETGKFSSVIGFYDPNQIRRQLQ
jgi:hypothetical protein